MKLGKYIHLLSLDVCIGAIAYQYYFYQIRSHSAIPFPLQVLLFCSIWFAYLMDRLIDVRLGNINDRRHLFIVQHKRQVYILFFMLGVFIFLEMMKISNIHILQGLLLVFGIGLYWIGWIKKWFGNFLPKEFITALLYTLGILYPWESFYNFHFLLLAFIFFLIVLHYLKLFLQIAGKFIGKDLVLIELTLILSLICYLIFFGNRFLELMPLAITLGVQLIIRYFYPYGRTRTIAEMAYWSPILLMIYELF